MVILILSRKIKELYGKIGIARLIIYPFLNYTKLVNESMVL